MLDLAELWEAMGGVARAVVVLMAAMSVASAGVMVDRWLAFARARRQSRRLVPALAGVLPHGDYQAALAMTRRYRHSHLAPVIAAGLLEMDSARRDPRSLATEIQLEAARQSMDRAAMVTAAKLKARLGVLATVGSTAPFVGLFGTVVGIINAFASLAAHGGGFESVSAGIAEALVTTAGGLLVALPAVWAYNFFQHRVERCVVEMASSGSEMTVHFLKELGVGARSLAASSAGMAG